MELDLYQFTCHAIFVVTISSFLILHESDNLDRWETQNPGTCTSENLVILLEIWACTSKRCAN